MNADNRISPELQAKIDALPDENLKANIVMVLCGPGIRKISNEKIFDNMVQNHEEVMAERATWRQWRDDEVLAFVAYFKQELPEDYAEYLRQEVESNEIESDLSWKVEQLSEKWLAGLAAIDYILLLGKVRDHLQAQLHAALEHRP